MAGVTIELVPIISGGHMKEPLQLRCLEHVEGRLFFKACKTDPIVTRLLLGKAFNKERILAKTCILEELQSIRNSVIESITNPPALDDLGLDDQPPSKAPRVLSSDVPPIITLNAPGVGPVAPLQIRTLARKKHEALWLEVAPATIDYLAAVVAHQISDGLIDNTKPKGPANNGVYFDKTRRQWRARRSGGKSKYFSDKSYDDAYSAAMAWAQGCELEPISDVGLQPHPLQDDEGADDVRAIGDGHMHGSG